jgi:hypothetical protein
MHEPPPADIGTSPLPQHPCAKLLPRRPGAWSRDPCLFGSCGGGLHLEGPGNGQITVLGREPFGPAPGGGHLRRFRQLSNERGHRRFGFGAIWPDGFGHIQAFGMGGWIQRAIPWRWTYHSKFGSGNKFRE